MRATFMYGAGDVRVEDAPDPQIQHAADAIVRVVVASICGSDLHPYASMPAAAKGQPMGHEFIGIVEDVGKDVVTLKRGDLVISPFGYSDGTCEFCLEGLTSSCLRGGFFSAGAMGGAQAQAVRVPWADGTLFQAHVGVDSELLPSLLTLCDVMMTGHHCAVKAHVSPATTVTVIGDGAVGLLAVLAARRLGAEQIILMGHHRARTDLGREFGASDVVEERGEEGLERVLELTRGTGTHVVLEAVGHRDAYDMSVAVARAGGTVSRVGVPQYEQAPLGLRGLFGRNVTLTGGVAPARTYVDELLPDVLEGRIEPGRVFDTSVALKNVHDGYRAMARRDALKVIVKP
jgi:threonine dehydrogenase-like Zn-dependent dehydrogenase